MRCPICHVGVMLEWSAGSYCSRRYAPEDPCGFEAGVCSSTADWDIAVERYRDQVAEEDHERREGDVYTVRPPPSPMATSPSPPLPPTSPAGGGASCACPACHGGPVIACRVCDRGMTEYARPARKGESAG